MTGPADGPIVIIGGGIIGCSLAFHLSKYGHDDVVVLEAGEIGNGATAKATGGIRQQFSSAINADISHEAVSYFRDFEDRVGEPFTFRQHGYLFLFTTEAQVAQFDRDMVMQRQLGIDARRLDPGECADLVPDLNTSDLLGGVYTPQDGSGSPTDAVMPFGDRREGMASDSVTTPVPPPSIGQATVRYARSAPTPETHCRPAW